MPENTYPKCRAIRFSLNGPVRTDIPLDTRALIGKDAEQILLKLEDNLEPYGTGWSVYSREARDVDISVDTRRESMVKPPYLATFTFDESGVTTMEETLRTANDPQLTSLLDSSSLKTLHLRFFSFEYATFSAEFNKKGENHALDYNLLRENVEALSQDEILPLFGPLFSPLIEQFRSAVHEVELSEENLRLKGQEPSEQETKASESRAIPRWAHRIFGLQFEDIEGVREASGRIEELIYTSSDTELEDLYPRDGASIYVASGNSALLSISADFKSAWENVNEIVEFQNAFFAKAEDLDEYLLRLVNRISLDKVRARKDRKLLKKIDSYATEIVDKREGVFIFKGDVSDYEGHLDPDSKKIWTGLWKQWNTGSKFDQIERQVDIMGGLYDRIITLLNQNQTKRLGIFALIFTLISGLSAFVDSCSFMRGDTLSASSLDITNSVVVVFLILILVFIFWLIMRR